MFNQDEFSKILSKINSTYDTMTDFAKKASFDRTYISKYINRKLSNPPTPKILEKIANASHDVTTYEHLMRVCGYFGNIRGDRLKSCRLSRNLSLDEVANKVGATSQKLSLWENGHDYNLDIETTIKLADFYNVESNWLMGCDVPMERNTDDLLKKIGATPLSDIQTVSIPILGTVKAGYNYLAQENIIDYVGFKLKRTDIENYYALNVVGDSMEPLFDDGDTVLVHKQDDFENGDNCVVLINGDEATVKQVYKGTTGIELKAVNPYYPPRIFTKEDMKTLPIKIIGVVEKSIRNFKKK